MRVNLGAEKILSLGDTSSIISIKQTECKIIANQVWYLQTLKTWTKFSNWLLLLETTINTYLQLIPCEFDQYSEILVYSGYNNFHNILRLFDVLPNFHHKWNDARLLLINMVYTSCLTSYPMTQDLGSYKIRKYKESVSTPQNNSLVPSLRAKTKIWLILAKNSWSKLLSFSPDHFIGLAKLTPM